MPESERHWYLLRQLRSHGCLKSTALQKVSIQQVLALSETTAIQELASQSPAHSVLNHLVGLTTAQIAANSYDAVLQTYQRVMNVLQSKSAPLKSTIPYRSRRLWFTYVELVAGSHFAKDRFTAGMAIAAKELKADKSISPALQGRFAVRIGELLLARKRIKDSMRFFELAVALDSKGERAERAWYWLTLHAYQSGDITRATQRLSSLKAVVKQPSLVRKSILVGKLIASGKNATRLNAPPLKISNDMQVVWRNLVLISKQS